MRDDHDLFGDGIPTSPDFIVKAQLRIRVRPARFPAAQRVVDQITEAYDERLRLLLEDLTRVFKRVDTRKSLGLYVIPGHRGDDLFKGVLVGDDDLMKARPPADPSKKREAVKTPGIRGGKWYRDKHGNIRYGKQPTTEFSTELSREEIREHLSHFRPTPWLSDQPAEQDFLKHLITNASAYGFSKDNLTYLRYWQSEGLDSFLDDYREDKKTGAPSLREMLETTRPDDITINDDELGALTYEDAVHAWWRRQPWGDVDFDEEVLPVLEEAEEKYREAMNNSKIHAALEAVGREVEEKGIAWYTEQQLKEDDYANLSNLITTPDEPTTTAQAMLTALAGGMRLIMKPKESGEIVKVRGGAQKVKGLLAPNHEMLNESRADGKLGFFVDGLGYERLGLLTVPQLMVLYTGARLNGIWDGSHYNLEGGLGHPGLSAVVLKEIGGKTGADRGTLEHWKGQLDENVKQCAKLLESANHDCNRGVRTLVEESEKSGKVATKGEALADFAALQAKADAIRADALEAQKDDDFDYKKMPDTMRDGIFGGRTSSKPKPHQVSEASGKPKELFKHQAETVNWIQVVKRGIVALGTGMGKTYALVTAVEQLRQQGKIKGPCKLFLPPTIMHQWEAEIEECAPGATEDFGVLNLAGMDKETQKFVLTSPLAQNAKYILLSTGALTQEREYDEDGNEVEAVENIADLLKELPGPVFIDEVHTGGYKAGPMTGLKKNVRYNMAQKILEGVEYAFGMTGTPVPNDPMDLFHLTNLFAPGAVGDAAEWQGKFSDTFYDEASDSWNIGNWSDVKGMSKLTQPFVFHKKLTDPDVVEYMGKELKGISTDREHGHHADIPATQELMKYLSRRNGVCEAILDTRLDAVQEKRVKKHQEPLSEKTIEALRGLMRHGLHKLCCISPELVDPEYRGPVSPKVGHMVSDVVEHLRSSTGDRPIVIFSNYPNLAFPLLKRELIKAQIQPSLIGEIHGGKTASERTFMQDMTNAGKIKILLVGMKSGGAGLNLQKSPDTVFNLDEPPDPGTKQQAIARVARVGQKHKVKVNNYRTTYFENLTDAKGRTRRYDSLDVQVENRLGGKQAMGTILLGKEDDYALAMKQVEASQHELLGRTTGEAFKERRVLSDKQIAHARQLRLTEIGGEGFEDVDEDQPKTVDRAMKKEVDLTPFMGHPERADWWAETHDPDTEEKHAKPRLRYGVMPPGAKGRPLSKEEAKKEHGVAFKEIGERNAPFNVIKARRAFQSYLAVKHAGNQHRLWTQTAAVNRTTKNRDKIKEAEILEKKARRIAADNIQEAYNLISYYQGKDEGIADEKKEKECRRMYEQLKTLAGVSEKQAATERGGKPREAAPKPTRAPAGLPPEAGGFRMVATTNPFKRNAKDEGDRMARPVFAALMEKQPRTREEAVEFVAKWIKKNWGKDYDAESTARTYVRYFKKEGHIRY